MDKADLGQNRLFCRNIEEWHDWLKSHHGTDSELWLQIKKAKAAERNFTLDEAVEEALCFGWIDGKLLSLDAESYLLRFTPRKPGSLWSLINRKRAEALMEVGRMTEAGLLPIRQAQENGKWQAAYTSKTLPELPADLNAALLTDQEAKQNFDRWSNNQKLQAVMWVEQCKQAETRARHIAQIVDSARRKQKQFWVEEN